jgi:alkylation response protein AidB-like acyl-CoA dehydrogenase
MELSPSEEQAALVALAHDIFDDFSQRSSRNWLDGTPDGAGSGTWDRDLWRVCCAADLVSIVVPEAAGGLGLGVLELCLVLEELGRFAAPAPLAPAALAAAVLGRSAGPGHREILSSLLAGESLVTLGLHEEAGGEWAPSTTAERGADGWILTGAKTSVPLGMKAGHVVVSASVAGAPPQLFLVPADLPGVLRSPQRGITQGADAEIALTGVRLPLTAQLPSAGIAAVERIVTAESVAHCAIIAGLVDGALALTADYVKAREVFGRPVATFQAAGQRLGDAYIDVWSSRLTYREAAWNGDEGTSQAGATAAVAKAVAAHAAQSVIRASHHLHGGIGMDRGYPLHRYSAMAKQLELTGGSVAASEAQLADLLGARS